MQATLLQNNRQKLKTDKKLVSVVIPTHKPNIKYFLRCFQSLKKQTYGFENIEVIIVAHNIEKLLLNKLQFIVKDYDNVKLFNLQNDKHSASSPRNYGMKFVTSRYVTFLDDDDALKENFIEDSINYMQSHDVQFISYARKNVQDNSNVVSIKYNELETQISKEIIYNIQDKNNIIPFEQAVFVTGKLFDFEFIKNHNIMFNEEVSVFEDFLFVTEVIKNSKYVCVQPHILGYYYHLNEDSTINNLKRSDKEVLKCTNGILQVIESTKSSEYLKNIELRELVAYIGITLFSSPDISYLTRCRVKELIQKYIKLLWVADDSNIYVKNRSKMNYKIIETEIMHPMLAYILVKTFKLLKINPINVVSFFTNRFD